MPGDWSRIEPRLLDENFLKDIVPLLEYSPDNWVVTEGFRPIERSNNLFVDYKLKGGPRAAPGGLSPHNYGKAIDVVLDGDPVKPGLQAIWLTTHPAWIRLVAAIWKHPRLRSGKWYSDWPHIEVLNWKDSTNWRQTYEENVIILSRIDGVGKYLPTISSV